MTNGNGCIYLITNTINNKKYVGQHNRHTFHLRWRAHKQRAKDTKYKEPLYGAMRQLTSPKTLPTLIYIKDEY